jgi:hypothetical protein
MAKRGLPAQGCQYRIAKIRKPGQNRKEGTARTARTGQSEGIGGTEQAVQDCQERTASTILP